MIDDFLLFQKTMENMQKKIPTSIITPIHSSFGCAESKIILLKNRKDVL